MNKEQEEKFDKFISLLIAQSRPCPTKFLQRYDDADFEYMKEKLKNFINKLLKEEREEIQRDINSVIGMLNGTTDRQQIKNYIVDYLKN